MIADIGVTISRITASEGRVEVLVDVWQGRRLVFAAAVVWVSVAYPYVMVDDWDCIHLAVNVDSTPEIVMQAIAQNTARDPHVAEALATMRRGLS